MKIINKKIKIYLVLLLTVIIISNTSPGSRLIIINSQDNNISNNYNDELCKIKQNIIEYNAKWIADYTSKTNPYQINTKLNLGCNTEKINQKRYKIINNNYNAPDEFDWRNVEGIDWTTTIKNQGDCGSCVAFGILGSLESIIQIEINETYNCDLSESFLFFCGGGDCTNGMSLSNGTNFLLTDGTTDENCFQYNDYDMSCNEKCDNWNSRILKISETGYINPNPNNIINALIEYGPLVTSMEIYNDFRYYSNGIYEHVYGDYNGGHCVTIIGYNLTQQYWICKNSWGTNWGENGWFKIKFGQCKIEEETQYLSGIYGNIPPLPPYDPYPSNNENNIETNIILNWENNGDPNGNNVFYNIYLGKNQNLNENNLIIDKHPTKSYQISNLEEDSKYYWKIVVEDQYGSQYNGPVWSFYTIGNQPPNTPEINGPSNGETGKTYTYQITAIDPNNDKIFYLMDWGDNTDSGWNGPFNSGETVYFNKSWNKKDTYMIKGRSMDLEGELSNWSNPIEINIVKSKTYDLYQILDINLLLNLLKKIFINF